MAGRLSAAQAAAVLQGTDPAQLHAVLKALPEGVDPQLAASALARTLSNPNAVWRFARSYRRLPAPVIRALLEQLKDQASPPVIFLRVYTDGEPDLCATWERALQRLSSLDLTYAWGSKQRRAKFVELAAERRVVEAIQASVVASPFARLDALAVLAIDASEASVDALMPHFERAARDEDRGLQRLQALKTYASDTPAMNQMLARIDALLAALNEASPALWFRAHLMGGVDPDPWFHADVRVDSRDRLWFTVMLHQTAKNRRTWFDSEKVHDDALKLGPCAMAALPAWLDAAAKAYRFSWDFESMSMQSGLRGKKRDRVVQWLRGAK